LKHFGLHQEERTEIVTEITRMLARQVRALFRRVTKQGSVEFHGAADGLKVRLAHVDGAVEYEESGSYPSEVIVLPLEALADFEGRNYDPVTLESAAPRGVVVKWDDGGVPQVKEYQTPAADKLPKFPNAPDRMTKVEPGFVKALDNAFQSAGREAVRYATSHIQLQGRAGQIVATDGRQLLVQSGFQFPFTEDVLIPATSIFGCKELASAKDVTIGKTATHLSLKIGPVTLHLLFNKDGRFPKTEQVIPSLSGKISCLRIDPADAAFLAKALPRMPGANEEHAPVTVDLNGQAILRASSEQKRATELVLAESAVSGPAVRLALNRQYLARALELGLEELCVVDGKAPLLFRGEKCKYVVVPLDKETALEPDDNAVRITSAGTDLSVKSPKAQKTESVPKQSTEPSSAEETQKNGAARATTRTSRNGSTAHAERKPSAGSLNALVDEAEALKEELRKVYTRTHHLLAGINKHRRQSKLVQSTLATLRQLKTVEA
jgi:hypothetical protein